MAHSLATPEEVLEAEAIKVEVERDAERTMGITPRRPATPQLANPGAYAILAASAAILLNVVPVLRSSAPFWSTLILSLLAITGTHLDHGYLSRLYRTLLEDWSFR